MRAKEFIVEGWKDWFKSDSDRRILDAYQKAIAAQQAGEAESINKIKQQLIKQQLIDQNAIASQQTNYESENELTNKIEKLTHRVAVAYEKAKKAQPLNTSIDGIWNGYYDAAASFLDAGYGDPDFYQEIIDLGNNVIKLFTDYTKNT